MYSNAQFSIKYELRSLCVRFYVRDLFYLSRIIEYFEAYIINVIQAEHILERFYELCSMVGYNT